jgi:hypothetical protein
MTSGGAFHGDLGEEFAARSQTGLNAYHDRPRMLELIGDVSGATVLDPFLDPGVPVETGYGCAGWPTGSTLDFPYAYDIAGLPPTMVVSVTGDGLTPHEGGIALAEQLGASLLTVDGERHGAVTAANPYGRCSRGRPRSVGADSADRPRRRAGHPGDGVPEERSSRT